MQVQKESHLILCSWRWQSLSICCEATDSYQLCIPACDSQPQAHISTLGTVCSYHLQKDSRCSLGPLGRSATVIPCPQWSCTIWSTFPWIFKVFLWQILLDFFSLHPAATGACRAEAFRNRMLERLPKCWSSNTTGCQNLQCASRQLKVITCSHSSVAW